MEKTTRVSVCKLSKHPYATILSYPQPTRKELVRRLRELKKLDIAKISFQGPRQLLNLHILGKGCVGIVVLAHTKGKSVALKIRRVDADRITMRHEAKLLKKANTLGVGPKFLGASKNFLVMEYIQGPLLEEWLMYHKGKKEKQRVFRKILEQCWRLDQARLDHGELSYAARHVIVQRNGKPTIMDFETASINRHPANVTAMIQYLFLRNSLRQAPSTSERSHRLIENLRSYKNNRNRMNFERVLKALNLDHVIVRCF